MSLACSCFPSWLEFTHPSIVQIGDTTLTDLIRKVQPELTAISKKMPNMPASLDNVMCTNLLCTQPMLQLCVCGPYGRDWLSWSKAVVPDSTP